MMAYRLLIYPSMDRPSNLLQYHGEDRVLRDVEGLSRHGRISRAFIRLCLEQGCPHAEHRLSLEMLLDWLFSSYPAVRAAAGLAEMSQIGDLPEPVRARLMMGNAMITLLEYAESRASDALSKRHLRLMQACVERALDC